MKVVISGLPHVWSHQHSLPSPPRLEMVFSLIAGQLVTHLRIFFLGPFLAPINSFNYASPKDKLWDRALHGTFTGAVLVISTYKEEKKESVEGVADLWCSWDKGLRQSHGEFWSWGTSASSSSRPQGEPLDAEGVWLWARGLPSPWAILREGLLARHQRSAVRAAGVTSASVLKQESWLHGSTPATSACRVPVSLVGTHELGFYHHTLVTRDLGKVLGSVNCCDCDCFS